MAGHDHPRIDRGTIRVDPHAHAYADGTVAVVMDTLSLLCRLASVDAAQLYAGNSVPSRAK